MIPTFSQLCVWFFLNHQVPHCTNAASGELAIIVLLRAGATDCTIDLTELLYNETASFTSEQELILFKSAEFPIKLFSTRTVSGVTIVFARVYAVELFQLLW